MSQSQVEAIARAGVQRVEIPGTSLLRRRPVACRSPVSPAALQSSSGVVVPWPGLQPWVHEKKK